MLDHSWLLPFGLLLVLVWNWNADLNVTSDECSDRVSATSGVGALAILVAINAMRFYDIWRIFDRDLVLFVLRWYSGNAANMCKFCAQQPVRPVVIVVMHT